MLEKENIREKYEKYSIPSVEKFIDKKKIDISLGLTNEQIEENKIKYGINEISQNKKKKWYDFLWDSIKSPFNLILIGIAVVLIYTDVYLSVEKNYSNIIVIAFLIIISTLLEFFEVYRSNQAAEKLKRLIQTKSKVIRGGKEEHISLNEITVGDIVVLSAGDIIPADLRILEAKDLYIAQSTLTGESEPVRKNINLEEEKMEVITDLTNICFMGTNVTSGYAKGIVIKIGDETYFGSISENATIDKPKTSFQKGTENVSKLLIRFMIVMIPIIFMLNVSRHGALVAFTFSVAIAIGITPLLLPVILSSSLAKGAVKMSKKKTIIKKLDSIQSFGAMNILCTDKTGTLTEDKIVLEKYLDINGKEDMNVLKHVLLNSYFQTGLRGNIDEAIIKRAEKENIIDYAKGFKKIDEIPFDFTRRRLSIIVKNEKEEVLITKGAIEEILNICTYVKDKNEIKPITKYISQNIKKLSKDLNKQGLRVLGVCEKKTNDNLMHFEVGDETSMILIGFIGFLDPPKESAKEAIKRLNEYGIRVIVLTGDNEYVTKAVCEKVDINTSRIITGKEIENLSDDALKVFLKDTNVFAKLSPIQKARIVRILGDMGNIVGYMGDGINDSPSLINSEVGISVDTAVDIAKETADIILLEKDLNVLNDGVIEGRKTFGNIMKYIKLAASFNFGEVTSILIASIVLPFIPITPIQLLVQSLIYDIGQCSLPFDNVDDEYVRKPRVWDINSIKTFMLVMGPISAIFDMIVFASLWFGFGIREAKIFQTIWFSYGIISNLIGLHVIRTAKKPFTESNSSKIVYLFTILISIIAIIIPFTFIGSFLGLTMLENKYIIFIFIVPVLYCILALEIKKLYIKKYKKWI